MSRGFLIFAHNNSEVDYALIALINALMIKANLTENNVTLVTDQPTLDWLTKSRGADLVARAFDQVICQDRARVRDGSTARRFHDTLSTSKKLPWHNGSRRTAYELSPYDETLVIDCDYLVCDRTLDLVWGSQDDILINRRAVTLEHKPAAADSRLQPYGIDLYWATCVYFRKSPTAKLLFDLVGYVRENWSSYELLYGFHGDLYRNDYAFSIALHMLSAFSPHHDIASLPSPFLLTSFDCDDLIDVPGKNELVFLVNDTTNRWRFTLSRIKNTNVHVLNKFAITRLADRFLAHYGERP